MTEKYFYTDPYCQLHQSQVSDVMDSAVVLESTIFYPRGGGQPGDQGTLTINGQSYPVVDTVYAEDRQTIIHQIAEDVPLSASVGDAVDMLINWQRRHRLMRMHTSMHLLCSLIPAAATGGAVGENESRLDFDLQGIEVDKDDLTRKLNELIQREIPISVGSITDEELDSRPELVRTMSVQPPRGQGSVRTITVADVDYQPCGGTHVSNTSEIVGLQVTRLKNKGKQNKRITIELFDEPVQI